MTDGTDTYAKLIALLDANHARYRILEHAPEGRTEVVSELRGHAAAEAAKCIVLLTKQGKKVTRYVLAVVPGDSRVDMAAIKNFMNATYVGFAATDVAERLAGSVAGTVLPFSFNPELRLVADPLLASHDEIFFNAARLDRSLALSSSDYFRIAVPEVTRIVAPTV